MKIYDTPIFCPLHCKKSRGDSADRFRRYGKFHESQICRMVAAHNQTNERTKKIAEHRWDRKQKRGAALLYRPTGADRDQPHQPPILSYRAWGTKGHPRVSVVCRCTTQDRLEA